MAAIRPVTPSNDPYTPPSAPAADQLDHRHSATIKSTTPVLSNSVDASDFAQTSGNPMMTSPLSQSLSARPHAGKFEENFEASQRGSSILDAETLHRSASTGSTLNQGSTPARSGTLKKRNSLSRKSSLKRSGSRRSLHAGSITGVNVNDDAAEPSSFHNVFNTPIPTSGTPTEILANRFQAWRKLLKDLIAYFREVQSSYEQRAKALLKVSNIMNNTNAPSIFLAEGGLNDANRILRDYHKQAVLESNKARDVENEVIVQLNGLRADLAQKIKEIKGLSGDFKNGVEKEKEGTRRVVAALTEALAAVDVDPSAVTGKGDPFVVRLAVDRQVERQIDEENYLHRAYLNLEGSGRELEAIVVGEIQKAYNALASILKRDADEAYSTVEKLRAGPVSMPRDIEWTQFIENNAHFVSPKVSLRRLEDIEYPGRHHPAAVEVRAGMLERKSKYLKSYTPGWYVLSPTHLHEFKSADRLYTQPPVMSLYLPDQKLGSHSQPGSSSHKFMLKGRQTGSMHRGHSWVFRAETYDTMMAWYEDIKNLTEKRGEERNAFVRRHTRSISAGSDRSVSTDGGLDEDEADEIPYSANASIANQAVREPPPQRPSPGGRFPSDVQIKHNLHVPPSPSSGTSDIEHDLTTASGGLQNEQAYFNARSQDQPMANNPLGHSHQHIGTVAAEQPVGYENAHTPPVDSIYTPQPVQVPPAPILHNSYQPDFMSGNNTYGEQIAPVIPGPEIANPINDPVQPSGALRQRAVIQPEDQPTGSNPSVPPHHLTLPIPIGIHQHNPSDPSSVTSATSSHTTSLADTPTESSQITPNAPFPDPTLTSEKMPFRILRQDTDISASDLQIPGKYPKVYPK